MNKMMPTQRPAFAARGELVLLGTLDVENVARRFHGTVHGASPLRRATGASIDSKIVALKKQMKGVQKEFRSLPEGKARDVLKQ